MSALGLRLSVKAYPEGSPVRDAAQLQLIGRLREIASPGFGWQAEAPIGGSGDLRAWDVLLSGPARIGVDAETRLHDIQAVQRRTATKARDGRVDRILLLVADSRHNRRVLREHAADLRATFPLDRTAALDAVRSGREPSADGIVVL